MFYGPKFQNPKRTYQLGRYAVDLCNRYDINSVRSKVNVCMCVCVDDILHLNRSSSCFPLPTTQKTGTINHFLCVILLLFINSKKVN